MTNTTQDAVREAWIAWLANENVCEEDADAYRAFQYGIIYRDRQLAWQPIETAIRDRAMLITDGSSMCVAEWNFIHAEWQPENCYASDSECSVYTSIEPTHWMPLPAPPIQQQLGKEG